MLPCLRRRQVLAALSRRHSSIQRLSANGLNCSTTQEEEQSDEQFLLSGLVDVVRRRSYQLARIDPLGLSGFEARDGLLERAESLLSRSDLSEAPVRVGVHSIGDGLKLTEHLRSIYQSSIGYEFDYLPVEEASWLANQIETMHDTQASAGRQKRIAKILVESEAFDSFMGKRFGQVKRYGLEGAESMLVAIDTFFQLASGVEHAVLAMAHRGRLNLMVGLLGYPAEAIFSKLQGNSELPAGVHGSGDVLSHLWLFQQEASPVFKGKVSLLPNSSHLESVNPVAQGYAHGLLQRGAKHVLPVQIHGDAAYNGQGVSLETLQMSQLAGFEVKGSLHLTINNQLGFTTPPTSGRSSCSATDLARLVQAPVFHVNADKPEDVARCAALAYAYRHHWGKDAFIDLVGYRRHGHNELDEPAFTQPLMYKNIRARPTVAQTYTDTVGLKDEARQWSEEAFSRFDAALEASSKYKPKTMPQESITSIQAPVTEEILVKSANASVALPPGFTVHPRLARFHIEPRLELAKNKEQHVDWATAEAMAVGSLLNSGVSVRLCGQDVGRGTFSQRHWQLYDQKTGTCITPLAAMTSDSSTQLEVVNSHLSEMAVASFEYGRAVHDPNRLLPIWEAQFGDFFNGAQIIWDAYVSSGEAKWALQCGLVVLLPHGYDGAGPEHSSARTERWLQLCDEPIHARAASHKDVNMCVVNPTTAANYFHLLRRQVTRLFRKPLIVASPKTLLRLPAASSPLSDLLLGSFQPVISDPVGSPDVKRVLLVSGKFYYDLVKEREALGLTQSVAIIRLEELCPFPREALHAEIKRYAHVTDWVWCQEEPENMGAYSWIAPRVDKKLKLVSRPAAAAPAAGYSKLHKAELQAIMKAAFGKL